MKRIITFFLLVSSVIAYSQELIKLDNVTWITFEDTNDYKYILIDTKNIWQITIPNKDILFLPPDPYNEYALISETNKYYSDGLNSSFQFKLFINEGGNWWDFYSIVFGIWKFPTINFNNG